MCVNYENGLFYLQQSSPLNRETALLYLAGHETISRHVRFLGFFQLRESIIRYWNEKNGAGDGAGEAATGASGAEALDSPTRRADRRREPVSFDFAQVW